MSEWPMYARAAAYQMGFGADPATEEAALNRYAERWGGVDPESLVHALQAATDDDWCFTITLLIRSAAPQARDVALPLLHDSDKLKQWFAALYLGTIGDRRALPVLQDMLTDPLSFDQSSPAEQRRFSTLSELRGGAAGLLGMLGDRAAVPALRLGLQAALERERALVPPTDESSQKERWDYDDALREVHSYQNWIVYALGRLQAFGALLGLAGVEHNLELWRVHLVMGHLHGRYQLMDVVQFERDKPELAAEVKQALTTIFGLSPVEQAHHLVRYERELLFEIASICAMIEADEQMHIGASHAR